MPYHHGNLRAALVDAATELARAGGPDAVVLRAVSREAGVSHNAAYRHFADRDDLLRAVRERCFERLGARMREAQAAAAAPTDDETAAWGRLDATGRAYVAFALEEPGWFRTAFGSVPAVGDGVGGEASPYRILAEALDGLVAVGAVDPARRPGAEWAAWSAVHGLATLLVDGPLRHLPAADVAAATDVVVGTVSAGLAGAVPVAAGRPR